MFITIAYYICCQYHHWRYNQCYYKLPNVPVACIRLHHARAHMQSAVPCSNWLCCCNIPSQLVRPAACEILRGCLQKPHADDQLVGSDGSIWSVNLNTNNVQTDCVEHLQYCKHVTHSMLRSLTFGSAKALYSHAANKPSWLCWMQEASSAFVEGLNPETCPHSNHTPMRYL